MRRVLRWLLRIAGALVALAVVAVIVLVIVLHTDWGRDQVRQRVQAALDESIRGEVRIGRLEGSVLGDLAVRDVVITNEAGRRVAEIGRASLNLGLWSLVTGEIEVEYLHVDGAVVRGRQEADGTLDLATLVILDDEPIGWDVTIHDLSLTDVALELDRAGVVDHLDRVEAHAELRLRAAGEVIAASTRLSGWWRERGQPIGATGGVTVDHGVVAVTGVTGSVGAVAVAVPYARVEGEAVVAVVTVVAPAAAVAVLVPDSPLRGDVALTFVVAPGVEARTLIATISGAANGSTLTGTATGHLDTQRGRGQLRAHHVELAHLVDVVPPAGAEGPHQVTVEGEVDLRARRAEARVIVTDANGGSLIALAAVDFGRDDGLAVRARVHGADLAIADVSARTLLIDVDVAGLPDAPRGEVHLDATGVRRGPDAFGPVAVDAASRDDGTIAVTAKVGAPRAPWRLDGAATVALREGEDGTTITVAIGAHRGAADGVPWSGRGGTVVVAPARVTVDDVHVALAGGDLALGARYERTGARTGDLEADVVARDVELRAMATLLDHAEALAGGPHGPPVRDKHGNTRRIGLDPRVLRGEANLEVHVARRDLVWSGKVGADARGVVLRRGSAPIDATLDVAARPRSVTLAMTVRGEGLGAAEVAFELAAPRRLDDVRAWRRLPRSAIRRGRVTLAKLDLAALARLAGKAPPAKGRVDGELTFTPDATTGEVSVRGLEMEGVPGPIEVLLALDRSTAGVLDATLDVEVSDLAAAHVTARVSIPERPFDLAAWARLDATAVRGLDARIDDLVLDADLARRLGLDASWQGHGSLAVSVDPGLSGASVTADFLGVRGGPLLRRVDLHVEARAERDRIVGSAQAGADGSWLLDASGELDLSAEALWNRGAAALRAAPVTGRVTVAEAPVRRLLRVIGRDQPIDGTVSVDASITGTVGAPAAEATITLADVGKGDAKLRALRVDATYAAGEVTVQARGTQADGGALRIDASAPLAALDDLRATVVADDFELEPLATLGPYVTLGVAGRLDADLSIRGFDPETAKVEGTVHVRDARFPLGASIGTLREGDVAASIEDRRLELKVTGKVGKGEVSLEGTARLTGLMPARADLTAELRAVTLLAPRRPRIDAKATARITRDGARWRVKAEVRDTRVVLSSAAGRVLHDIGAPDDVVFVEDGKPSAGVAAAQITRRRFGMRPAEPWLVGEVRLRRTTIKSDELRGQIKGKITLEVGDDAIAVIGSMDSLQGDVVLFDRRYRIDRAQLRFDGTDDPRIDVRLVHAFPQLTLTVALRGKLSDPELVLSSDPADYSQGQLLGFLFGAAPGGRPGDETRDAATMIASSLASATVGRYVRKLLPVHIDVLRFEAATTSDQASITVGQWLARRLYVGYRRRIDAVPEQNAGQAEIEYWLSPRVVVEGVAGDRGYHDVDLTWVRRW